MTDSRQRIDSSAAGEIPAPKRRKTRKGTQSCWECKRRKIRCTFAAPTDIVCDGCRSRHTRCISQNFDDEFVAQASRRTDRLSRVESLVEELMVSRGSFDVPETFRRRQIDQENSRNSRNDQCSDPAPTKISSDNRFLALESPLCGGLAELSSALLRVWPEKGDFDLILSIPVDVSILFHGVVCQPYSVFLSKPIQTPQQILQLPPKESHPVIIARKLLLLSTFIQGIPPSAADKLVGLSSDCWDVMSRLFNTATRLVTSNDELVSSLEGIESIMIESMYLNNAGNLRRAWVANRRAMTIAQMLGLHSSSSSPSMVLENETPNRIYADYMWYRLVQSDRYLSLMLGLPQGPPEDNFASLEALNDCEAVERLERMETVVGGLIIRRNNFERTDLAVTHKIDLMLQEASALMPAQWWLASPNRPTSSGTDYNQAFEESTRLTNYFAYNHLLVQLHLPYMTLSSTDNPNYDYSKITAAIASRAIVDQYVSFRKYNRSNAYCRGIDFVVFIASTTLCIAHIEARGQQQADNRQSVTGFQSLRHQRLNDRGLLEQTFEIMDKMGQTGDAVAQKVSSILRPLLNIEGNSSRGGSYHICRKSSGNIGQDSLYLGDTGGDSHTLLIEIPYFGTIQIEHRVNLSDTRKTGQKNAEEGSSIPPILQDVDECSNIVLSHNAVPASPPAGYEISTTKHINANSQIEPFDSSVNDDSSCPEMINGQQILSSATGASQGNYLLVPGLEVDVDDWALQGVDMALFSNLAHDFT